MSMMDYGFGYDEELPGGFQDADLEMREFEARAYELKSSADVLMSDVRESERKETRCHQ